MSSKASALIPLLVALSGCVPASLTVPQAWMSVPAAARIRTVTLDDQGQVTHLPEPRPRRTTDGPIHVAAEFVAPRIMNGQKQLTDPFRAVDSLDFSEERGEVAFSVKRRDDFEIGLVSSDGSPISWVPNDPADEVGVQWAPRGSKISYIIRAKAGDVVRTLHVPTSFELAVAFPHATIYDLAWDPQAERYAVAYSTPDASDRVEVLEYDGGSRRMAVEPAQHLDVEVEALTGDALVLRPVAVRYSEKLPVVVWIANDLQWNDARGALQRNARVAMIVTRRSPDAALFAAIEATPWMDRGRVYVVGDCTGHPSAGSTCITGDAAIPAGRYRRAGNVVTVAPAVVQSFSAGFIADQLKRDPLTNGSSR